MTTMGHVKTQEHADAFRTHQVFNQPTPLEPCNLYTSDVALQEALHREGGGWAQEQVAEYGELAGGPMMALGFQANEFPPRLRAFDRYGHRIDEVEYHPAYHEIMGLGIRHGLHGLPWRDPRPGAHVARAALVYLHCQAEAGTQCPLTMTFASIPTLRQQPELATWWEPRILSTEYDPRPVPADQKAGVTIGMGMTEKQGGTDVRANATRAYPLGGRGPGQAYELVGHKWFCSAPMCDAFLVTAQTEQGISCFLLPRWRPDGTRNAFHIQRLKDKLGNRSNASGEVEFAGAYAVMVGEEGRGIRTIIEMVALTRFDCIVGSAALMRQALAQAIHHCTQRQVFGRALVQQPLMANVLADLALESEAALAFAFRVARAMDHGVEDEAEALLARIARPIGKYWVCKRTPFHVHECQECLGGLGYVEESNLPRLYREAPVNSIWEGSGNVQCLDVLRSLAREPRTLEVYLAEVRRARGADRRFDAFVDGLERDLARPGDVEYRAREMVERLALALQASLLIRAGQAAVADGFVASRLAGSGRAFGTLPPGVDAQAIVERARPRV